MRVEHTLNINLDDAPPFNSSFYQIQDNLIPGKQAEAQALQIIAKITEQNNDDIKNQYSHFLTYLKYLFFRLFQETEKKSNRISVNRGTYAIDNTEINSETFDKNQLKNKDYSKNATLSIANQLNINLANRDYDALLREINNIVLEKITNEADKKKLIKILPLVVAGNKTTMLINVYIDLAKNSLEKTSKKRDRENFATARKNIINHLKNKAPKIASLLEKHEQFMNYDSESRKRLRPIKRNEKRSEQLGKITTAFQTVITDNNSLQKRGDLIKQLIDTQYTIKKERRSFLVAIFKGKKPSSNLYKKITQIIGELQNENINLLVQNAADLNLDGLDLNTLVGTNNHEALLGQLTNFFHNLNTKPTDQTQDIIENLIKLANKIGTGSLKEQASSFLTKLTIFKEFVIEIQKPNPSKDSIEKILKIFEQSDEERDLIINWTIKYIEKQENINSLFESLELFSNRFGDHANTLFDVAIKKRIATLDSSTITKLQDGINKLFAYSFVPSRYAKSALQESIDDKAKPVFLGYIENEKLSNETFFQLLTGQPPSFLSIPNGENAIPYPQASNLNNKDKERLQNILETRTKIAKENVKSLSDFIAQVAASPSSNLYTIPTEFLDGLKTELKKKILGEISNKLDDRALNEIEEDINAFLSLAYIQPYINELQAEINNQLNTFVTKRIKETLNTDNTDSPFEVLSGKSLITVNKISYPTFTENDEIDPDLLDALDSNFKKYIQKITETNSESLAKAIKELNKLFTENGILFKKAIKYEELLEELLNELCEKYVKSLLAEEKPTPKAPIITFNGKAFGDDSQIKKWTTESDIEKAKKVAETLTSELSQGSKSDTKNLQNAVNEFAALKASFPENSNEFQKLCAAFVKEYSRLVKENESKIASKSDKFTEKDLANFNAAIERLHTIYEAIKKLAPNNFNFDGIKKAISSPIEEYLLRLHSGSTKIALENRMFHQSNLSLFSKFANEAQKKEFTSRQNAIYVSNTLYYAVHNATIKNASEKFLELADAAVKSDTLYKENIKKNPEEVWAAMSLKEQFYYRYLDFLNQCLAQNGEINEKNILTTKKQLTEINCFDSKINLSNFGIENKNLEKHLASLNTQALCAKEATNSKKNSSIVEQKEEYIIKLVVERDFETAKNEKNVLLKNNVVFSNDFYNQTFVKPLFDILDIIENLIETEKNDRSDDIYKLLDNILPITKEEHENLTEEQKNDLTEAYIELPTEYKNFYSDFQEALTKFINNFKYYINGNINDEQFRKNYTEQLKDLLKVIDAQETKQKKDPKSIKQKFSSFLARKNSTDTAPQKKEEEEKEISLNLERTRISHFAFGALFSRKDKNQGDEIKPKEKKSTGEFIHATQLTNQTTNAESKKRKKKKKNIVKISDYPNTHEKKVFGP